MKSTLRAKFMAWLVSQTLLAYLAIIAAVYLFNLHERREHPDEVEEERKELFIILGLMAATLPPVLVSAWWVSKQLLEPVRSILDCAESIRAGNFDQRIPAPNPDDEIGRLARALNEAFDSYHQAMRRLDRFSMDAAHQLRNPLAAIRTNAEICLQQNRAPADYTATIERILDDVHRLSHTVDQLLMLARLGRVDLAEQAEPIDLAQLVRQVVEPVEPAFEQKQVQLTFDLPTQPLLLSGVPRLLEQALANLIDNALRLTPPGGKVHITASRQDPHLAALTVADSGSGLSEHLRAVAVDKFSQTSLGYPEGTGLGLAIVADVVRAHRGTVTASNSHLGGAQFVIQLPANP